MLVAASCGAEVSQPPGDSSATSPPAAVPLGIASPTQASSPTPPDPGPRLVDRAASQLIVPPSEFPLAAYKVAEDQGTQYYWRRTFDPLAALGADYAYVLVEINLYGSATAAQSAVSLTKCDATKERAGTSSGQPPKSAAAVTAPQTGDASLACAFAFPDGSGRFDYSAATRNVLVLVQVAPSIRVSQSVALEQAISVTRRQIAIIDRVAPATLVGATGRRTPGTVAPLQATQVILPLGELPLRGYRLSSDTLQGFQGLVRTFVPTDEAASEYLYVAVDVSIWDGNGAEFFLNGYAKCDPKNVGQSGGSFATKGYTVSFAGIAYGSIACGFSYADGKVSYAAWVQDRDALVGVRVFPRTAPMALALDTLVSVGKRQLEVIDRLAPP